MSVFSFKASRANRSPNADRTWREVEQLIELLAVLADTRFGSDRRFTMFIGQDGVRMALEKNGNEYQGRGSDPWEAAADLANNAGGIATSIQEILRPKA